MTETVILIQSKIPAERKQGLSAIRKIIENQDIPSTEYFKVVKPLLDDRDNDCKWQAFIVMGSYMETMPEETWEIILRYGSGTDYDTRSAVATVMLEHYFELNPHLFDAKFREYKRLIKNGNKNLLDTLNGCRSEWGSDANKTRVARFLSKPGI